MLISDELAIREGGSSEAILEDVLWLLKKRDQHEY